MWNDLLGVVKVDLASCSDRLQYIQIKFIGNIYITNYRKQMIRKELMRSLSILASAWKSCLSLLMATFPDTYEEHTC